MPDILHINKIIMQEPINCPGCDYSCLSQLISLQSN